MNKEGGNKNHTKEGQPKYQPKNKASEKQESKE